MDSAPAHRLARPVVGMAAVVAVLVVLHGMDHPQLTVPPVLDLRGLDEWVATAGPIGVVMGTVRLAATCMAWYLLVASTTLVVAHHTARRGPAAVASALLGPVARDLVLVVVGTGVLVATPTIRMGAGLRPPAVAGAAERLDRVAAVAEPIGKEAAAGPPSTMGSEGSGPPRMARLPDESPRDTGGPPRLHRLDDGDRAPPPEESPEADESEADESEAEGSEARATEPERSGRDGDRSRTTCVTDDADGRTTWTVAPGDHFWHVAEQHLHASAGSPPAEARVRDYWRRLVAANRGRLVDPDNPDLLLPGQVLRLPDPSLTDHTPCREAA